MLKVRRKATAAAAPALLSTRINKEQLTHDVDVENVGVDTNEVENVGKYKEEGVGWRREGKGGLGQEWQLLNSCPLSFPGPKLSIRAPDNIR